jgi:autoinducer 2-degrading protein
MIVTLVHVWVKESFIEDFIAATFENHKQSIKEPGNLRFDILRDTENPTKFVFYEAFETEEAIAMHKKTDHYLKWRDTVADWMSQSRQGIKHTVVYPVDSAQW